jgi:Glucan phosphorylase
MRISTQQWHNIKRANKQKLADRIFKTTGVEVSVDSLFDIQVKRIHEYKRQHLAVLHIITLYNRIKHNPNIEILPRTFVLAVKPPPVTSWRS